MPASRPAPPACKTPEKICDEWTSSTSGAEPVRDLCRRLHARMDVRKTAALRRWRGHVGAPLFSASGATDRANGSVDAFGRVAGDGLRCPRIQQAKRRAKTGAAGDQCRVGLDHARRDVVQYDDIADNFLMAGRRLARDGLFDQPRARADVLDQRYDVGNDRVVVIASIAGWERDTVCCLLHEYSPSPHFLCRRGYLCVKSRDRTNTVGFEAVRRECGVAVREIFFTV